MGKSKTLEKSKGKEIEAPSKPAQKKRKAAGVVIREAEEDTIPDIPTVAQAKRMTNQAGGAYRLTWEGGPLHKRPESIQARLFYQKMGEKHSIRDNMCLEKRVYVSDFRALGFEEKFRELGWEAVTTFKGNEDGDVYEKSVMEWLSTLRRVDGNNPPKSTVLSGSVGGKTVTMSFSTLRRLANFDSKPDKFYNYLNENVYNNNAMELADLPTMYAELFNLTNVTEMKRVNLKPLVRVLLSFMTFNVTPRLGDKVWVRKREVPVMYGIMTGALKVSFCQLVLMHVWQCRNAKGKKLIPHGRLISALIEDQNVVLPDEEPYRKAHIMFSFRELASSVDKWTYKKTKKWHKLNMDGVKIKVMQWGKEPLGLGEMDAEDSSDEELMRRKREAGMIVGEGPSVRAPTPGESGYSWGVFDEAMQQRVVGGRPPEYGTWDTFQQAFFDQGTRADETRGREHQALLEQNSRFDRMQHLSHQMDINMRAYDENQYRRHLDYYQGVDHVQNPPYVNYDAELPYEPGMTRHPTPQVHGSMWLPYEYSAPHFQSSYPYQPPPYEYTQQQQQPQQQQQGEGGSSSDPFDMSSFYEHLGGFFGGPPGPSYR